MRKTYQKPCNHCGKLIWVWPSQIKYGYGKFCSWKCRDNFSRVKTERFCKVCHRQFKAYLNGRKTVKYCSNKCSGKSRIGKNNSMWRGHKAGYNPIHSWVRRHKGKPTVCYFCGFIGKCQWANIDHKYNRNLNDYISLCASCHKIFDYQTNN